MTAAVLGANLHTGYSAEVAAEFAIPDVCGCRDRNCVLIEIRQRLVEVAVLRDEITRQQARPPSRRRFNVATMVAGEQRKAAVVQAMVAGLDQEYPCRCNASPKLRYAPEVSR